MLAIPVSWVRESTRSGAIRVVELGRYRRIARRLCWLAGACSKAGRPLTLGGLECAEHLDRSAFRGVDELVFCHPDKGSPLPIDGYVTALEAALAAAESTDPVRLFRDLRHRSPTNGAAAGETPIVLMSRAATRT